MLSLFSLQNVVWESSDWMLSLPLQWTFLARVCPKETWKICPCFIYVSLYYGTAQGFLHKISCSNASVFTSNKSQDMGTVRRFGLKFHSCLGSFSVNVTKSCRNEYTFYLPFFPLLLSPTDFFSLGISGVQNSFSFNYSFWG